MNIYVNDTLIGLPQIDHSIVPLKDTFQSGKYECIHMQILFCVYVYVYMNMYVCLHEHICMYICIYECICK
jgi:hypothetical protein